MKTKHSIYFQNAKKMNQVPTKSVDLVVTSSPYPLIEMWDSEFVDKGNKIKEALSCDNGLSTFELMHLELDEIWCEVERVLKIGGICCINIGDAVRTIGKNFRLYPNHARILTTFSNLGLSTLPEIIWRKPTNAPNKFMGSGMLPPTAYVTLEHEFILIFRKGGKREFKSEEEKVNRRESAYFWEERNIWFSDIWDFRGTTQTMLDKDTKDLRTRSAAFPFELAYRLINMFSVKNDTILDPFLGTGTTSIAAMISARNSIGFEIDESLKTSVTNRINDIIAFGNSIISNRLNKHKEFVTSRLNAGKEIKYTNQRYEFPVITRQEEKLFINTLSEINRIDDYRYEIIYNEN